LSYVELRAHTAFSFSEGAVTPERLVARAVELEYRTLGLTDCADMGGVVRFAIACDGQGVRPIVGVELVVDGRPLALLARTREGFHALGALVTRARSGRVAEWRREDAGRSAGTPPRGRPQVTWRDVAERAAGLTLLTGPSAGHLAPILRRGGGGRREAARQLAEYREAFGAHVAVEVQLHDAGRSESALATALIDLAERERMRWVVCGDPRYVHPDERRALDVLTALRHECTIDQAAERGLLLPNDTWMLRDPRDMAVRWAGCEAGIVASEEIAAECSFDLAWVRPPLPAFPVPDGVTPDERLARLVFDGARVRWGSDITIAREKQIFHELKVIRDLGFAGFFLVMHDAVQFARDRKILCQGRGSAANSAVTYCLGITAVDPVANGLLFERFLSPARADGMTEAPDIDVDIEHDRREEVLTYMYEKYGRAHAAITCVVQQYSASTAVQDVCRAYGVPVETAFALSKRLHHAEAAPGAEQLRAGLAAEHGLDVTTPRGEALVAAIAAFDGMPRLRSTHPGGFVLSAMPLGDYCPVEPTTMGRTIIQYDKDDIDAVGIPKYDFLGLGSLAAVRRAFDVIEGYEKQRPELYTLPQDDAPVYDLISRGDTIGLFQIESRAQISSLVQTKPETLYDIVVQVALIRPGPIQAKFVHPYVERRRGRETFAYPDGLRDKLEPILGRTFGIPIFQEQAMSLSMALAGYNATEADELRRTMGHQRKRVRLEAALLRLYERMRTKGIADEVARQLVEDLTSFANYGFPESHAWSFALIAYATAWLKVHHATAFYCGLLNAQPMGFYSVATLVHDAKRHGVEVRLPCLVGGAKECTAEAREGALPNAPALRVGWRFVRGLGDETADRIAAVRDEAAFTSIVDVVRRARLNRADATALARAHAFAAWEPDRRRAAWEALRVVGDDLPLAPTSIATPDETSAATDGYAPKPLGKHAAIVADYRAIGLSTSGHPMERYRAWCRRVGVVDAEALQQCKGGERVIVAGLVVTRQRPVTAKGAVFLLLEDEFGQVNVVVWKQIDEQNREAVRHTTFLAVYGQAARDGSMVTVVAKRFKALGTTEATIEEGEVAPAALTHRSHDFH
jgi:error-prone DNA polymerase